MSYHVIVDVTTENKSIEWNCTMVYTNPGWLVMHNAALQNSIEVFDFIAIPTDIIISVHVKGVRN